jgi:hypothetical protein
MVLVFLIKTPSNPLRTEDSLDERLFFETTPIFLNMRAIILSEVNLKANL